MAKTISELWADNLINPETTFNSPKQQEWLDKYFDEHHVRERLNDLMEKAYATSLAATVQYRDSLGRAVNQYIPFDNIFPLAVRNGEVTSCAFASDYGDYKFLQIHEKQGNKWLVTNLYFDDDGKRIPIEDIENSPMETYESEVKLFQLYSPAIANNINMDNPLGISIYANAIDELKAVDVAYDAIDKEVRNGRMRVFVQGEAMYYDKGKNKPVFNKDQDEFYLLPEDAKNPDGTLITISAPTLRVEQLIENLKHQLNLLGSKCGLGDNAFYSANGSIYTNTDQVISTNSKFYKTRAKHTTKLEPSLVAMVKALYYLETGKLIDDVYIEFDDTIIHDKDKEWNRAMQLFNAGLIDRIEVYKQLYKLTEEEAIQFNNEMMARMNLPVEQEDEGVDI